MPDIFKTEAQLCEYLQTKRTQRKAIIAASNSGYYEYTLAFFEQLYNCSSWDEDYDVYYFYADLNENQIKLASALFPKLKLVDIMGLDSLSELIECMSHTRSAATLSPRIYAIKLLESYDITICFGVDLWMAGDLKARLDKLDLDSYDFAALPNDIDPNNIDFLFELKHKHQLFTRLGLLNCDIKNFSKYLGCFYIYTKNILNKVSYHDCIEYLTTIFKKAFSMRTDYMSHFEDEVIIFFLINKYNWKVFPLDHSIHMSPSFFENARHINSLSVVHFLGTKLWNNKDMQLCFPYWHITIRRLLNKLAQVEDIPLKIQAALSASKLESTDLTKNTNPQFEILNKINFANFYNEALPELIEFFSKSRHFHLEPLNNYPAIQLCCNDLSYMCKVSLIPLKCYTDRPHDKSHVRLEITLFCSYRFGNSEHLMETEGYSSFESGFKKLFPMNSVLNPGRRLKFLASIPHNNLSVYLQRLEELFTDHHEFLKSL